MYICTYIYVFHFRDDGSAVMITVCKEVLFLKSDCPVVWPAPEQDNMGWDFSGCELVGEHEEFSHPLRIRLILKS